MAGRKRLGAAWLIIDPIATSMVYLFVFTVIRSNPDIESILMGIGMFRIFQSSFNSGISSVQDFTGGIKGERVRTRVLRKSMLAYRVVDNSLQSSGIGAILLFVGTPVVGVFSFLVLSQILGLISEGVALNLALLAKDSRFDKSGQILPTPYVLCFSCTLPYEPSQRGTLQSKRIQSFRIFCRNC